MFNCEKDVFDSLILKQLMSFYNEGAGYFEREVDDDENKNKSRDYIKIH